jgi:hypothetical protein
MTPLNDALLIKGGKAQAMRRLSPLLYYSIAALISLPALSAAFSRDSHVLRSRTIFGGRQVDRAVNGLVRVAAASDYEDVYTIQILMSDTGGGHRASANALRDAFDTLYPGQIQCDIVDIYTDYGPVWPYNDYVSIYKLFAKYDFLWGALFEFGETDVGLCVDTISLETVCFDAFKQCLSRPSGTTNKRADMVISVHPLCQDIALKILSDLDSNGKSRAPDARTTPFATVVTDLAGAHKAWFNKK